MYTRSIDFSGCGPMPNIAAVFKAEITRLARKEIRERSEGLKKTVASQQTETTNLKKRLRTLETLVKQLSHSALLMP